MTDAEKLKIIEQIAREAFSPKWYEVPRHRVDAHRTMALANIFALFEYDGAVVSLPAVEPVSEDDGQVSFDDLFSNGYVEGGRNNDTEQ